MEENKIKKEMTLNGLAELIIETKKELKTKIDFVHESLAMSTQNEFLKSREHINGEFVKVHDRIENLDLEIKNRRVHIFDHKDLEYRVEKLEEKVGIARKK
jgi:hypothetical protein